MAWTANLKSTARIDDQTRLVIEFTDGVKTVEKAYFFSSKQGLKNLVQAELKRIEELNSFTDSLSTGSVDLTPDTPTQAELDRKEYANDLSTYRHMVSGVNLGLFTGQENQITNLKTKLINAFKTAYIDLL